MQLELPLKQVGSFIKCSRLKVFVKCCKFLSFRVILKLQTTMFLELSRYLERFFNIFSKNKELFWQGGLYKPTISRFLNCVFISRYMASVSLSKCKFNCLDTIFSFAYIQRPPPKQFLSYLNIL